VPIGNTPFEILSLLSTPVDLYALGVLGVRSLLVNPRTPLPVVLDEVVEFGAAGGDGAMIRRCRWGCESIRF